MVISNYMTDNSTDEERAESKEITMIDVWLYDKDTILKVPRDDIEREIISEQMNYIYIRIIRKG